MCAEGFTVRMRWAAMTPRRKAVCIGTEIATTWARATFSVSKGSTERSSTAGA
jgi:hypothetical protein